MRLARATPMYLRQLDSSTFENRALLSWPLKARRGAQPAGSTAHLLVRIELPEGGTSQRGYRPVCTELLEVNVPTSAITRG